MKEEKTEYTVTVRKTGDHHNGYWWNACVTIRDHEYGHAAEGATPQYALAALAIHWARESK